MHFPKQKIMSKCFVTDSVELALVIIECKVKPFFYKTLPYVEEINIGPHDIKQPFVKGVGS